MSHNVIRVVGARVHNLKNITVEIPRDKFVVITGEEPLVALQLMWSDVDPEPLSASRAMTPLQ